MNSPWQPFREPLRITLLRTVSIALVVGLVLAWFRGGGTGAVLDRWPLMTRVALWVSLGGHFVELFFLNVLRPRMPAARWVQAGVRVATWFVGGIVLGWAMRLTAQTVGGGGELSKWPPWWAAGLAFIGIELVAHLFMQLRGRASFYNGRG